MPYKLLHVGCGDPDPNKLPPVFRNDKWQEVRVDINPDVHPDILGTMLDLGAFEDNSVDALFSSHNLEHVFAHEVPVALKEWFRVLRPGGFLLIRVPDVQAVAVEVAKGRLEDTLYVAPVGPISAIDVLWGFRRDIADGNVYMAHKTGFTPATLERHLHNAGFSNLALRSVNLEIEAGCNKPGAEPILRLAYEKIEPPKSRWSFVFSLLSKKNRQ